MEDAAPLFGLAAMLWGAGFVIHALGYWWFRARQLDRTNPPPIAPATVESRLARIETAIEAVAIEVERLGEAHRFISRFPAEAVETQGALPHMHESQERDRP